MTDKTLLPEVEMSLVVARVIREKDEVRLHSMCSLLNTFNYAVQVQGNRNVWKEYDFRAFAIALVAMDEIGEVRQSVAPEK